MPRAPSETAVATKAICGLGAFERPRGMRAMQLRFTDSASMLCDPTHTENEDRTAKLVRPQIAGSNRPREKPCLLTIVC
jgi:hypothetical protein